MTSDLTGLVAVVTGGGAGIGLACARRLAASGASVAVLDRDPPAASTSVLPVSCDVTDDAAVRSAIEAIAVRFGRLDIVVNNVGISAVGTVADNPDAEWHRVLDVNLMSVVRVSRAALPYLRKSSAASIVNLCSIAANAGLPRRALYSASKGAILALTRAMAADHVHEGIRVNSVSPGTVETDFVRRLIAAAADPVAERAALVARQPHGRLVEPDEVAAAVLYLASPAAASTTGTDLEVDGGMAGLRRAPAAP
jgi:2-keto-3-deoxy-L-fuconate dehydrogenase